jgi:cytoskeletal protein CcmA (bactofilin family)
MFQKLKPVDVSAQAQTTPGQTQNPTTTESVMSNDTNTTTTNNDAELDALARRDQNATTYSPRPATTTGGFSSFPARPNATTPSYGSASTTASAATSDANRKLVIGQGINISGEIEACPHLVVEGQVEATLKGANILEIAETGVFFGSVEINEATIAGRFEGDLKVDGRLTVRSTGVIIGTLSYRELAVEAGATIEGKITPLNGKAATRGTSQKSTSNTQQKRPSNYNPDNTELPFATKAAS